MLNILAEMAKVKDGRLLFLRPQIKTLTAVDGKGKKLTGRKSDREVAGTMVQIAPFITDKRAMRDLFSGDQALVLFVVDANKFTETEAALRDQVPAYE